MDGRSIDADLAGVRLEQAHQDVQESGLKPVSAAEGVDVATMQFEVPIGELPRENSGCRGRKGANSVSTLASVEPVAPTQRL
jgi:hypothetical protein